jgi:hypothetical protein
VWIAWNINSDDVTWPPSTIEEKVEIFYQRALGWQLHIADLLANGGEPSGTPYSVKPLVHSGFAVLQICLSYFETIGHYEQSNVLPPKGSQGYFFKKGVRSALPQLLADYGETVLDELFARLYGGARCGLYHNSMTVPNVGLGQPAGDAPMAYDSAAKILAISPERLPRALKAHLEGFRIRLLDPKEIELRQNFERRFNEDNGIAVSKS